LLLQQCIFDRLQGVTNSVGMHQVGTDHDTRKRRACRDGDEESLESDDEEDRLAGLLLGDGDDSDDAGLDEHEKEQLRRAHVFKGMHVSFLVNSEKRQNPLRGAYYSPCYSYSVTLVQQVHGDEPYNHAYTYIHMCLSVCVCVCVCAHNMQEGSHAQLILRIVMTAAWADMHSTVKRSVL
jgi:hypothetical protein